MASTYLQRTPSSASNRKTWTWSGWVKRSSLTDSNQVLFEGIDGSGFPEKLQFTASDILEYDHDIAGTDYTVFVTDRVFRDTNAWYHIVFAKDTTQSTEADRIKIYVNGEQQSLSEYQLGFPPQNYDGAINDTVAHYIGANNGEYFNGSMSHIHFCDGTQYQASDFGQYDANGVWTIKTSPSVTYGTNGFFILKDGNSVTDQSGNSNNFTVGGGTLTNTEDNPSNVFATLNPLIYESRSNTFSNGNLKITGGVAGDWTTHYGVSTLGMSSGKYYVEAKIATAIGSQAMLGIIKTSQALSGSLRDFGTACIDAGGRISGGGGDFQTGLTSFASGDIAGAAFDATNGTIQFYRNGSAYGNPVSSIASDTYYFATNSYDTGAVVEFNFGNGYFGTTAVASAGTNASGIGIFEYDVPTGYTALSTKGLNL